MQAASLARPAAWHAQRAGVPQNVPYQLLKHSLDLHDERELEDFIITSCIYGGLLTGKLDQRQQCLRTHSAVARDVRRENLGPMLAGFQAWCALQAPSCLGGVTPACSAAGHSATSRGS